MKKTVKPRQETKVFSLDQLRSVKGAAEVAERGKVIGVTKWPN